MKSCLHYGLFIIITYTKLKIIMKNFTKPGLSSFAFGRNFLLYAILFLSFSFSTLAQYTLTDADVELVDGVIVSVSYDFSSTDIVVPDVLDGQAIIGIKDGDTFYPSCFMNKEITSIVLPSGLKSIGNYAFRGNKLTSIELPEGLERIGQGAFGGNSFDFKTVDFPNSLVFIGRYAFSNNGVTSVTLPSPAISGFVHWLDGNSGLTYAGGETVAYSGQTLRAKILYTLSEEDLTVDEEGIITACSYDFEAGFKDIIIPESLNGNPVLGIGDGGWYGIFRNKGLYSVVLPAGLEKIGNNAFADNSLAEVVLPSGLKSIGDKAFSSNDLKAIELPNSLVHIGQRAFAFNDIKDFTLPTPPAGEFELWITAAGVTYAVGTSISADSYDTFSAKIIYTLTDDDVIVEEGLILSCNSDLPLTYFVIPETLDGQTVVGIADGSVPVYYKPVGVFLRRGIKEVELPASLVKIGDFAFYDNSITEIAVPDGLSYIGLDAFTLNSSFAGIVLPAIQNENFKGWIDNYDNTYAAGETVKSFYERSYSAIFTTSISGGFDEKPAVEVVIDRLVNKLWIKAEHLAAVDLYDLTGRKVYDFEGRVAQLSVDLSSFPKGVYVVNCRDDSGQFFSRKIILD